MKSSTFMSTPSPLQKLSHPLFEQYKLDIRLKRDDLINVIISGNKWRKLKYNLAYVKKQGFKGIVSFGGAYSNHIHALSYACYKQAIPSIGIIRGEAEFCHNFTLSQAKQWQMELQFVDRKTYRLRNNKDYLKQLAQQYPDYFIIPEGGSNHLALTGVAEICSELNEQTSYDTLITPVGSAGTLSGLIVGDKGQHSILGIAVLKQEGYLADEVNQLINHPDRSYNNWHILNDYHDGGYAKFSQESLARLKAFSQITKVPFEPIYSGKMILALLDLVEKGYFEPNHRIVLIHTGGLQGLGGLIEQGRINSSEWPLPPELQAR
ncbi:1-aminocyclopropane-1-carboxylate deaminase/D-cysteine desulfhydrase [Colwelliaceae bacterium 6441]